jgi:hypothetical protein
VNQNIGQSNAQILNAAIVDDEHKQGIAQPK